MKKYGIPKSPICGRVPDFFMQPSQRRSLAVGTSLRNFVSENPRARQANRNNFKGKEKRSPRITRNDRHH
ncbi:MAG: hypothetical protein K2G90_07835 [Muribaculaceae bacterium]|nr:hypothetical protein [Muribaculaceae bacterium]